MSGWIKLHRKLQDNPLWTSEPFTKGQAWVDLMLIANHSSKEVIIGNCVIPCSRGQIITSYGKLSKRWRWGVKKVRLYLSLLRRLSMIELEGVQKATQITLLNYKGYQDSGHDEGTMRARSGHDEGNKQECKECEEGKKNTQLDMFDEFWCSYPKKVKKGTARKVWLKLKPSKKLLDKIIEALEWQKKSKQWNRDNGQYIPNPSTYLNASCWEDEKSGYETGIAGRNSGNCGQGSRKTAIDRERDRGQYEEDIQLRFLN